MRLCVALGIRKPAELRQSCLPSRRAALDARRIDVDAAGGKECCSMQGRAHAAKRKDSEQMAAGAPRKYKSVKAMQDAIDAYFKECEGHLYLDGDGEPIYDKNGQPVIVGAKPPTITGLALSLGFTGRQALIDYQGRAEFTDTVTRAKARCEEYAEARLYDRDGANGAKFSLGCNFGWTSENEKRGDPAAFAALLTALKGKDAD